MFDYFNSEARNSNVERLLTNDKLECEAKVNLTTGEAEEHKIFAKYKGLKITIVDKRRVFVSGSLPKFLFGNNYQNLSYDDFKKVVNELMELFGIEAEDFVLHVLEFGFSLEFIDLNITDFLKNDLIYYQGKPKSEFSYPDGGFGVEFIRSQFLFKFYNKSAQYGLDSNLIRIEIRIKKMQYINKYGITTLKDLLNENIWYSLKKLLHGAINETIICSNDYYANMDAMDMIRFSTFKSYTYWADRKPNPKKFPQRSKDKDYKEAKLSFDNDRKYFTELIKKHGFDYRKKQLLEQIDDEYRKALPNMPSLEEYENLPLHIRTSRINIYR